MGIRRLAALLGTAAVVLAGCSGGSPSPSGGTGASDCVVAVSWNNFQQPRWAAADKPNIQKVVEDAGGTFIDADANLSNEQQITDVNTLISKGAKVLILLAQDTSAILPAVQTAKDAGIPIIAYDRLTVREYPKIDEPVVTVETTFKGASADIVESQVTQILEESLAGIEGIDYMSSISRPERSQITARFRLDREPDAVDAAPHDERPRRSVPQPAEQHRQHEVDVGAPDAPAVAAQRDVEVVPQPA